MIDDLYFPKEIYIQAFETYVMETKKDPQQVLEYCLLNYDFFVEIAFSFIDKIPYPEMKEQA